MLGPADLVLCCGTVQRATFQELCAAAAAGGFAAISLWPHLYEGARESGLSDTDMRHMLADHGLEIAEHDALLNWLPGGPAIEQLGDDLGSSLFRRSAEDFFRIAEAVGGRSLNVAQGFPSGLDVDTAAAALAPICKGAADCGLLVSLEFLPWTDIPDPATALAIAERSGEPNAGLMVDSWHVFRGMGDFAALDVIPPDRIVGVQLNDAPREPASDLLRETMEARLIPGEGDIDLVGAIRGLDAIGSQAPLGVEVYSARLAAQNPIAVARRVADATRDLVTRARR